MRNPHEQVERSLFKVVGWTIGVLVVVIVGSVYGYREFRKWQVRRLVAQGNALVVQGDYKRASLNARRILQINPESVEGFRIMAQLSEKIGVASAVEWRRRVMDAGAANIDDLIQLARDAVRFDDRPAAEAAISHLPPNANERADYHALIAELAYGRADGVAMERELSEAIRLDPENKEYVIRRAALELTANDLAVRDRGRDALVELQKDPKYRAEATRHLLEVALRTQEFFRALGLARDLNSLPGSTFNDRLLLLSALHGTHDGGLAQALAGAQKEAINAPEETAALINWMNSSGMAPEAIAWSATLPQQIAQARLVVVAISDSYLVLHDWSGLQQLCKSGNWGTVDFLRSALAARASRELGDLPDSVARWAEAKRKVTGNTRQTLLLAQTVQKWDWRPEAIDLLWMAANDPVQGEEALSALYSYFAKTQDTENLYRVLVHRHELHPDDANLQNNVAQLSLLLGLNTEQGHRLAREVYEKDSHNPAYASTYAFSLYTKGDAAKAVQILDQLTEEQRRQPQVAAYCGIFLAAVQNTARAAEYLDLGSNAKLLPEEKALLEKARRSLAQR